MQEDMSPATGPEPAGRRAALPRRLARWVGHEFVELVPAILYFFVAFTILTLNEQLVLGTIELDAGHLLRPLVGALLVAKILLVVDLMPLVNAFADRPLIWGTIWKSALYWLFAIVFQLAETLAGQLIDGRTMTLALAAVAEEATSYRFVLIQLWLSVLLSVFVALQTLVVAVGPAKVRALFFGSTVR